MPRLAVTNNSANLEDLVFYGDEDRNLAKLMHITRDIMARARDIELSRCGLTGSQSGILMLTGRKKGLTIGEISYLTLREPHSVLALVNRMTEKGLVRKTREGKRDKTKIFITPKGRKLFSKAPQLTYKRIFSTLTPREKKQLAAILAKVRISGRQLINTDIKFSR